MANAQVILREKIEGLGAEADVVKVRAGYARNYLVPQGKAFEATRANLRHVENLKAGRAKREADELEVAKVLGAKISKLRPKFTLEVGQGGRAFGSVTSLDIHKQLEAAGIVIDRDRGQIRERLVAGRGFDSQGADTLRDLVSGLIEGAILSTEHFMQHGKMRADHIPVVAVGLERQRIGVRQQMGQAVGNGGPRC